MPTKATSADSRCHAFGTHDIRRCRLQRTPGQKTCIIHKNYYKDWHRKNNPQYNSFRDLSIRKQIEHIYQVQNKLVDIPESWIQKLHLYDDDYFDLYIKYTDYSPLLNKPCFETGVNRYLFDYYYKDPQTANREFEYLKEFDIFEDTLEMYMKNIESTRQIITFISKFIIIRKIIKDFDDIDESIPLVLEDIELYRQIFMTSLLIHLNTDGFKPLLYSINLGEYILPKFLQQKIQNHIPELMEFYHAEFLGRPDNIISNIIRCFNRFHSFEIRQRCKIFKEELIQKAWHPKRIEKYVEMGVDVLDM
jgi:hypothetical protein